MKKIMLLILTAVLSAAASAQNSNSISIGKIDTLNSKILGEQRKLWIYSPAMTSGNLNPQNRYPVLYLLDGDTHFASVVGMIQQLSQANGNSVLPEMIVVGITNTDRTRDLTPTHVDSDLPAMDSSFSKTSGGGKKFIAFIQKELFPYIESNYPTAPYKVLVGHSFGGLTAMDVLTDHTELFNAYLAIDPSMWYNKEQFLATAKKKLTGKKYDGTRLFIGIANTMPQGMEVTQLKKNTSADTRHIRSIFELDKFLKDNPGNNLTYASKYYGNDSHISVPLISEYDGLRFIFNYYLIQISQRDFLDSSDALAIKYRNHYNLVSKEMGYRVSAPEMYINYLGYDAMSKGHFRKAAAFFKMNCDNYPRSSNVYDSYGDLFVAIKDTANAIANFKKALSIYGSADTKRKLNELEGKAVYKLTEQELETFIGVYELEGYSISVTLQIRNGAIWAIVPGQDDKELVPVSPAVFAVRGESGYTITFQMQAGKAQGFVSVQPNGIFKAKLKK